MATLAVKIISDSGSAYPDGSQDRCGKFMEPYIAGNDKDVACPHCRKTFTPLPLSGGRVRGFKCPHCRLFVPMQRRPA